MISVLFLGNPQVGKTSLVSKLCNVTPSAFHIPTEGIDHNYKVVMSKGQKTTLQFWDIAGTHKVNPVIKFYYQKANVFVVVFSLADYKSFKNVKEWIIRIKKHGDPSARIFLVGNKTDLSGEIPEANIQNLIGKYGVSYYETSIRNSHWCQNMLKEIIENTTVKTNNDYAPSPLKLIDESPKEYQNQPEVLSFPDEKAKQSPLHTKADPKLWESDLRRIETKFDEEIVIIKKELKNRELESPKRIELEVTNKLKAMSMEKDREQDRKIDKLYEYFENFRSSIIEEMMQSKKKSKISQDEAIEEIEALKNRVRTLEKVTPASRPTQTMPVKAPSDAKKDTSQSTLDQLETMSKTLFEDINSLKQKCDQNENKLETICKNLFEDMNVIRKQTEQNEDKVNGMFLFVERELKQTESHLINELNQKLKDLAEVSFSKPDQESECNPEFDKMIKDLNDSIRRCIADTDDFYNNLRQEVDVRERGNFEFLPHEKEDLYARSALSENIGEPLVDFRPKNKFVSMSIALASSQSDEQAYEQENKENVSENLPPPKSTLPKFKGKVESEGTFNLKPKFHKLEKASRSFQEIQNTLVNFANLQNNLKSYKEIPINISSPTKQKDVLVQDEIARIWKTINKFMQSTQEELGQLRSEVKDSKKLNILQSKNPNEPLSLDDIKDVLKSVQGEMKDDVAGLQRDCETMCKGLRDMINNYYEDTIEKIGLTREQLEAQYSELKARFEGSNLGTFKAPMIEHVPSDISPQGMLSPVEDISFEFKMLDKKVNDSDKEKVLKENLNQAKKQQKENKLMNIEDKLNSFWKTTSLIAERLAKLENKMPDYKDYTPSQETRAMPTFYWA